jgi:hypothetical protein
MDNLAIARVLTEIGDLLEIKGENPFKIRAYRNAADTIVHEPGRIAEMTAGERLALPGVGKDLAGKIGELIDSGAIRYHQELLQEFLRRSSTCCTFRASAPRPSHGSMATSASAHSRILRVRPATDASAA